MITQQQRKELTLAAVDCEHQINADCIRLWRDPTKEGTALAQLMDRIEAKVRQYIEQGAQPGAAKSLNAMAADLLRPYLKPGQKVIWRESFRWHDDNGVLSNHYDGMELEQLSDAFGYDWRYDMNLKHAAIVWDKAAAPQPQQEQSK